MSDPSLPWIAAMPERLVKFICAIFARAILVHVPKLRFGSKYSDALALRSTNTAFGSCLGFWSGTPLKLDERVVD